MPHAPYAEPDYGKEIVDLAGTTIAVESNSVGWLGGINALEVIDNWRAAHAYPLNAFYMTLKSRTKKINASGIVAQRVKRFSSIQGKLERYDWLKLSDMQDIAGCRAIVNSVEEVHELVKIYQPKYSDHELDHVDDYIRRPKSDGYRGLHLIYRYKNTGDSPYSGLKIEMQFRSFLQHCWATAVETVDIFYREGLKSHQGSPEWRRFFSLMGAAIAMKEGCRPVPRTPRLEGELKKELREYANILDVRDRLTAFGETLNVIGEPDTRRAGIKYVLLVLNPTAMSHTPGTGAQNLQLRGFRASDIDSASKVYTHEEREGNDVVLVSVSDAASLRRAYPNYFFDTTMFLTALKEYTS